MADARFEDGGERPLRLLARDGDDLAVISALCQDAVLTRADMAFARKSRRFALLLNRFRWEDGGRHGAERVRALLSIEEARAVRAQGLAGQAGDTVVSLLSVGWEPGEDGTGRVLLTFAGDGAVAVEVEALEVSLRDVTRPYRAPSGRTPAHGG